MTSCPANPLSCLLSCDVVWCGVQIMIPFAGNKFDKTTNELTDEATQKFIKSYVNNFVDFVLFNQTQQKSKL